MVFLFGILGGISPMLYCLYINDEERVIFEGVLFVCYDTMCCLHIIRRRRVQICDSHRS